MAEFNELNDILEGGSKKAVYNPPPLVGAVFDGKRTWMGPEDYKGMSAKERRRGGWKAWKMVVRHSPTNMAKCRRCGDQIEKGPLRLGYPYRYSPEESVYTGWLHPDCYASQVFQLKKKDFKTVIFGYEALTSEEKESLWTLMKSNGSARTASLSDKQIDSYRKGSFGPRGKLPIVKVPPTITQPMLPFQIEGLAWMIQQESSAVMGGILADEMGMGKTLQAISLLCAKPKKEPTLIVVPMAAVNQWVQEIKRFTRNSTLNVLVYHGAERANMATRLWKSDVVITTYQTMEIDFRTVMDHYKLPCVWCQKLFLPEQLTTHQKYRCGPDAKLTDKQARTLKTRDQKAAERAIVSMGIGSGSKASSSTDVPPTVTNIFKSYMQEAGVEVESKGFWNVQKEFSKKRNASASSSSSSKACKTSASSSPSSKDGPINRERLAMLDRTELQQLCKDRGIDASSNKKDMVDRIMTKQVKGMKMLTKSGQNAADTKTNSEAKVSGKVMVNAFAKGKAKAQAGKAKAPQAKSYKKIADGIYEEVCTPCVPLPGPLSPTYEGPEVDLSGSPLHSIAWGRIILDEAHRIKGRTNSTAQAAYALKVAPKGTRWCLTGTPLQNRVGELYSLVRFLRMRPFAFYYCNYKDCYCECAKFGLDRKCGHCGHSRFLHYSSFKTEVSKPILKYGYMGKGKRAFETLRRDILDQAMLRRTKQERKKDLHLKPIKITIRKDKLTQAEDDFYKSLYMQSCVKFDTFVQAGTLLHNYAHIFDLLTSLRRAVDHPYLIVYGGAQSNHMLPDGSRLSVGNAKDICSLCQDDINDNGEEPKRVSKCGHAFHDQCIREYMQEAPKLKCGGIGCPSCYTKLTIDLGDENDLDSEDEGGKKKKRKAASSGSASTPKKARVGLRAVADVTPTKGKAPAKAQGVLALPAPPTWTPSKSGKGSSKGARTRASDEKLKGIMKKVTAAGFHSNTKINAVLDETKKMLRGDPTDKAIIFSQFGNMLELVEFKLKQEKIDCLVFRGGMTMQARTDALNAFNTNPKLRVILMSLKAGGEGLNLQVANHVFLLDPWWNPACEQQAMQRAHRIGQAKRVYVTRFVTANTVEEKMLQLQDKKNLVFEAAVDGSAPALQKLNEEDLRFLFQQ